MKRAAAAFAACVLFAAPALAVSFAVSPMRVDLGPGDRTATITVDNDGDEKASFQVSLFSWRQTAEGQDEYTESHDLIFFPQIFSVNPHDKRIVRIGVKGPAPDSEKAFRLYIAQMPAPLKSKPTGNAQVRVILRFGVPVFIAPSAPKRELTMDAPEIAKGKLRVTVRNTGNQSAKFDTLTLMHDKEAVAEAAGTYVLPGASRTFEIPVDPAKCIGSGNLEMVAQGEQTTLKRAFAATAALCEHS